MPSLKPNRRKSPGGETCRSMRMASSLDDYHRLDTRCNAGGRHEFGCMRDLFDVEEDCLAVGISGQEVQRVAEVDIGHLTHRDDFREANAAAFGPIDDGRH